jgi:hypothetical protein
VAEEDYISFDNALRELQLSAEQLKRLVSEGEIRAIRGDQNTMRFRREEIDRLKQDTGKTIQFTEASSETLTDDLLFDESDELDISDEGASTVQLSGSDTFVSKEKQGASKPAGKPAGKAPAPQAKTPAPAPKKPTGGTATQPEAQRGATGTARRTTGRATHAVKVVANPSGIGGGMVAALILTSLVLIFSTFMILDIKDGQATGITDGLARWAAGLKK